MRFHGTIQSWNDARGFGFIAPRQGGPEVFVHIEAFAGQRARPRPGQAVSFAVEDGPRGKKRATKVALVHPPRKAASTKPPETPARWSVASLALPLLLAVLVAASLLGHPPRGVLWTYPVLSALTFVAYARDKSAARQGRWRTPEPTLHLLALLGGWPGALVAQQVLRHKSSKAGFRAVFRGTVALNLVACIFLASPYGPSWARF